MKFHNWTPADDRELLDMAARHVPVDDRARRFDVSVRAVQFRLTTLNKRGGVPAPGGGARSTQPAREPTTDRAPPPDIDIPVEFEEPAADPFGRVEIAEKPADVAPPANDSARSNRQPWEVGSATREHILAREVAEFKRRCDALIAELADRDEQLASRRAFSGPVAPIAATRRAPGHKRHGVPVLLCSDWHIEEPVRKETVNGLNEYNLDIAAACIERMADAFEWMLLDSRYDCREGVVWLGGDLFSGHIHEELMEQNLLSPVESIVWLKRRLVHFFKRILAETKLERIIVVCNDGNHGRMTHKMRVSTRTKNSLEWLLYQELALHFADEPRLHFQIAEGVSNYLDVYDTKICFQHGDTFKYGGGVGGLLIPVRRGANELRKYRHFDHLVIGHFHQRSDMGDIIVNGSMIGMSPYGMSIKATPEPRQQSWFLIDQERGKCLSAPVWLPQS